MGLLDNLKNRRQGGGDNSGQAVDAAPSGPGTKQPQTVSMQQWLEKTKSQWCELDAKAPETSETTPDTVRKLLQEYLPLNEEAAVQRMGPLMLNWSVRGPLALSICQECGFHLVIMADLQQSSLPTSCKECDGPMASGRIIYSKEVGRIVRAFLAAHGRCIGAIAAMSAAMQKDNRDLDNFDQLYDQALKVAQQEGHGKAERASTHMHLAIHLAYAKVIAQINVRDAIQLDAALPATFGGNPQSPVEAAARGLEFFSSVGHAAADAQAPNLAIQAYEQVTNLRAHLLDKFPQNLALRKDQAFDLDELGMTLRQHEPQRRPEALTLVRKAMQLLDALDHDDPSGRGDRAAASQEIRSHLNLPW